MPASGEKSPSTSLSLLDRLRCTTDAQAWEHLANIYTRLIRSWIRPYAVSHVDTDDLVQEVLLIVLDRLPDFQHNRRKGAFRCWLRHITANCLKKFWESQRLRPPATGSPEFHTLLAQLEDPDSDMSRRWDREHDLHVTHRLLEMLRPEFAATTWRAFCGVCLEARPAAEVAAQCGISVNSVYIAKSRVLARLRQEAREILD